MSYELHPHPSRNADNLATRWLLRSLEQNEISKYVSTSLSIATLKVLSFSSLDKSHKQYES